MATGESGTADFMGTYEANSFEEAVEKWFDEKPDRREYYGKNKLKGTISYWGCRFFDNESDARKSFG